MPRLRFPPHAVAKTFALAAATAALIAVSLSEGRGPPARPQPLPRVGIVARDPLQTTLTHCNTLGAPAADDPTCKAAWAATRAHFFTPPATPPQFKRPSPWVSVVRPSAQTPPGAQP